MSNRRRKRAIRQAVISRILGLSLEHRSRQQTMLYESLTKLPGFAAAKTVLLYVSAFPEEFETRPMLGQALGLGKQLVCPRVNTAETRLDLHVIDHLDSDFEPGVLGIPEPRLSNPRIDPQEIDWVLVPGVAFDDRGYRIGRGAGHYDRLLPRLRADAPRWALVFDEQWIEEVPAEPHDQTLDGIQSPGRFWTRPI